MMKLFYLIAAAVVLTTASLAGEASASPLSLNDSGSYQTAATVKLGRATLDALNPGGKNIKQPPKEKFECVKDTDCTGANVCRSNKCVDPCTGVTCAAGKKCSVGSCVACGAGESCGCSSPSVSNGSGSCIDSCSPNYCASATPTCSRTGNGTTYSCACTSSSCGAGKQCNGSSCGNCARNTSCGCPAGQLANGSGGCSAYTCGSDSACGQGKQCANAGTLDSYCFNCGANAQCTCPSGYLANGSGGCVKPVCYDNTPCGAGRQCTDPGKYNAKCDPCPSGTQCTCPSGLVADGSGGCRTACAYTPASCAAEKGGSAGDWSVTTAGDGTCSCSTSKKYVILADAKPDCKGSDYYKNLRRIKAVKNFGSVKAGDLGGYIESEANLSQDGNAWVGCDSRGCAWVTDTSRVSGNALVQGAGKTDMRGNFEYYCGATRLMNGAQVYGDAKVLAGSEINGGKVYDRAVFHGIGKYSGFSQTPAVFPNGSYYVASMNGYNSEASASGDAQIYLGGYVSGKVSGNAIIAGGKGVYTSTDNRAYAGGTIYGRAKLLGDVTVSGNAQIYDNAVLTESIKVQGNARVYGNAQLGGYAYVEENAQVYGNAVFKPGSPNAVTYLRGNASLSGTATVNTPDRTGNHMICKGSYTSGVVAWQASYGNSNSVCPKI